MESVVDYELGEPFVVKRTIGHGLPNRLEAIPYRHRLLTGAVDTVVDRYNDCDRLIVLWHSQCSNTQSRLDHGLKSRQSWPLVLRPARKSLFNGVRGNRLTRRMFAQLNTPVR